MERKETRVILAIVLIVMGLGGILKQAFHINLLGYISFWNLGILILGLYLEWQYFSTRKSPGILVPGGILTVVGVSNFLENLLGGVLFVHFPGLELGLALGLFQLYWFGTHNKFLLIPIVILLVAAINEISENFFRWFNSSFIWSIALILIGVYLIINRKAD